MFSRKWMLGWALAGLLLAGSAHALMITGSFTGIWFDDSAPGQGFIIQVVEVEGTPTVVVYWFTFDAEGNQVWLYGQGPVDGELATMDLFLVEGGELSPEGFDPSNLMLSEWGDLTVAFSTCNEGLVTFNADDPPMSGEFEIVRLTQSLGDDCTGGISDNVPPGSGAVNQKMDLVGTGEDPDAWGRIHYLQNANFTMLKIHVHKLDQGTYELLVGGESKGMITTNRGGNGKIFFRSPTACNWELLDFEPLDQTYEVVKDGVVYLTGSLDAINVEEGEGEDDGEPDGGDDGTECG